MDFETREIIIHNRFVAKIGKMYHAPRALKDNQEGRKLYGEEMRRVINQRLSSAIPNKDVFEAQVDKLWDRCIAKQTMGTWFTPSLVAKEATKVNSEYLTSTRAIERTWDELKNPDRPNNNEPPRDKSKPETMGWTIEKCDEHIAMTKQMMKDGKLNIHMGNVLIRIPMKAKERLLKNV